MSDPLDRAAVLLLAERAVRRGLPPPSLPVSRGAARAALEAAEGGQQSLLLESELREAAARLATWRELGIELLCPDEASYPASLRTGEAPPVFLQGRLTEDDSHAVAVIGSRAASPEGLEHAVAVVNQLASGGYTILSGLAAGIDAAAHRATLSSGGRTIAAIGTGHLHVYPSQHRQLQAELAQRTAVLSPFPPATTAARWTFPVRNALMGALAIATVVVEASAFSGTRSAIRASLARGRPVFLGPQVAEQSWAHELREHRLVQVFASADDVLEGLTATTRTS